MKPTNHPTTQPSHQPTNKKHNTFKNAILQPAGQGQQDQLEQEDQEQQGCLNTMGMQCCA
jgi:hypothetical protein